MSKRICAAVLLMTSFIVGNPPTSGVVEAPTTVKTAPVKKLPKPRPSIKRDVESVKMRASRSARRIGWSHSQFVCLNKLWDRESRWRHTAKNRSGAYGIPQALPGSKMSSAGKDWRTNPDTQVRWGMKYIKQRYGTPCVALRHSLRTGWY